MEKKVELKLLSVAGAQNNARIFALIMGEKDGTRYFPILANETEAQAVVAVMQNVKVVRPLVHDAFADYIKASGDTLTEVVIISVHKGTFYANLVYDRGITVECKAADAIALALHFSCPIYALDSVVESENIVPDINRARHRTVSEEIERMNKKLEEAVAAEDYETAAKLRDIIKELSANAENKPNE